MLENIKLDIIYYGAQKDFEMEFNLCGCCRMRLLTAIADDLKSFVNCVKIAVARSRVVLLCGKLDGDNGIFNIISKAVGREFEEVDNSLYGIAGDGKTKLLKESIPLVCNDGTFLGCVIEQGPQAIIMLSDQKKGRKEIMQNLIHPYVKELSKSEIVLDEETLKAEESSPCEITNSSNEETAEIICESENAEVEEQSLEISSDDNNLDLDNAESQAIEETQDEVVVEVDDELEDVSLNDFSKVEEAPIDTTEDNAEIEEEIITTNEVEESGQPQQNGLIFSVPDDNFDESDQKLFSSDAINEYRNNFSLIGNKDKNYRYGSTKNSPIILILFCIVLCLLGILAYYLLVKPTQAGITISENFNNLFSFALRGVYMPW